MITTDETAVQRHDRMMREEREQAERLRSDEGGYPDIWRSNASRFAPMAGAEPPVVGILADLAGPDARVIDVGAGGGRITVPLARRVREMVAVEPSAAMREVLERGAHEAGITNLTVVPKTWEGAEVGPADFVYAAHVTYSVQSIAPFLQKLDADATRVAALVAFEKPAQHAVAPFWKHVYGEERLLLPVRAEIIDVLRELGADPREIPLEPQEGWTFADRDDAFEQLRRRLYIGMGNLLEERLWEAIDLLLVGREGVLVPDFPAGNGQSVLWWTPGRIAS